MIVSVFFVYFLSYSRINKIWTHRIPECGTSVCSASVNANRPARDVQPLDNSGNRMWLDRSIGVEIVAMVLAVLAALYWPYAAVRSRQPIGMVKFCRYLEVDAGQSSANVRYSIANVEMMNIQCRSHNLPSLHAYQLQHYSYPTNYPLYCAYPTSPNSLIPFCVWPTQRPHWMANHKRDAANRSMNYPLCPRDPDAYVAQLLLPLVCQQNTCHCHIVRMNWPLNMTIQLGDYIFFPKKRNKNWRERERENIWLFINYSSPLHFDRLSIGKSWF